MAALGDFFPSHLKNAVVVQNIKVGSVFRVFDNSTNPPKIKRFIVVGTSSDSIVLAIVYINTEINPFLFTTPELKSLHYPIAAASRSYIDHDSFVDCSQLIEKTEETLRSEYLKDMKINIGELSQVDLNSILGIIKKSRTIDLKTKKKFGFQ